MTELREKPAPTLADALLRAAYDPDFRKAADQHGSLRDLLMTARKFYLDEGMSSFLADLADRAFLPNRAQDSEDLRNRWLESLRVSARAPHHVTWIELDLRARMRRLQQLDPDHPLDPERSPRRLGWLIWENLPGMYFLLSGMSDSIWRHDQLVPKPVIGRSLILWHTDDGVLTDRTALMHIPEHNGRDWQFSELATGMVGYRSERVGLLPWTGFRDHRAEDGGTRQLLKAVHEQVGELRYVWAFLATINEIPVTRSEVRQSKGFVARGAYRKFMDHTIIRLTVPHERFRALARKIIAHARRRAHQVRGHWRKDWHYPGSESCAHEWMLSDVDHKYCRLCPRREIFVHEHQRGDSSLGFVTADYQVHHE